MKKIYETPKMEILKVDTTLQLLAGSAEKTIRVFDKDNDDEISPNDAW